MVLSPKTVVSGRLPRCGRRSAETLSLSVTRGALWVWSVLHWSGSTSLAGAPGGLGQVSTAQLSKKIALPWRTVGGRHDHCGFSKLTWLTWLPFHLASNVTASETHLSPLIISSLLSLFWSGICVCLDWMRAALTQCETSIYAFKINSFITSAFKNQWTEVISEDSVYLLD